MKLQEKVAIVSGSGRGIGREIALKLAAEGAAVVVNDLDAAPAEETVAAIEAAGAFSQFGGPLPASHASSFTSAGAVGAPWAGAPWSAPPSCSAGAISMSIDPSEPNDMPLCCIEAR